MKIDEKIKKLTKAELRLLLTNAIKIMAVEGFPQVTADDVLERLKTYK